MWVSANTPTLAADSGKSAAGRGNPVGLYVSILSAFFRLSNIWGWVAFINVMQHNVCFVSLDRNPFDVTLLEMDTCAIFTFTMEPHSGVAKVARHWQRLLGSIGYETLTVAGAGQSNTKILSLSFDSDMPLDTHAVEEVLGHADLVVLENMGSFPLKPEVSLPLLDMLAGRPAIMHHHDLPWERTYYGHTQDLPRHDPSWEHVVLNETMKTQMKHRGFEATKIYNPVDVYQPTGDRDGTRRLLGVEPEETLVLHPVQAVPRKNIPAAISFTEKLGGVYWQPGPAAPNYASTLRDIFCDADCRILKTPNSALSNPEADMYAAADIVVYPSVWESFGMPPAEAAANRVPAVVGEYPASDELRGLGFQWWRPWQTKQIADFFDLGAGNTWGIVENNWEVADRHLSMKAIQHQIATMLERRGWLPS